MTAEQIALDDAQILKLTEADMLERLMQRYNVRSQAGAKRYVRAKHVRSHAGFSARRTADFIALDTWESKLIFHGHEVKVSRSDWLAELKDPDKAMEFIPWMDYWWIVVADHRIVVRTELPDGWGLMTAVGGRLHVLRQARRNHDVRPDMPRTRLAAFVRAVARTESTP